ncbi:DUF2829 domain-containing protein [Burkholderia vietnamiensis]|uniref:DUF2829 domain-containing protein n=1 Tax=Burkholderia vietnamiensis TaxID=60552 RepID=UPI001CB39C76|nr:DUF2829 domain-containing protein [Burkholderia vietnamiensis]CAG9228758.1 conserved hypothetical protein [Burkholderia vietnamiensis]
MTTLKRYIGTKLVNATPMTRQAYNDFRGWATPDDENGADEGFLVEYVDGGAPNTLQYAGYVSWSPKGVFERSYRPVSGITFGEAIEALKAGKRVARAGWNGKGMWLALVRGYDYNPDSGRGAASALGCKKLPWIGMKTADHKFVPWSASQTDMLAEDWTIAE